MFQGWKVVSFSFMVAVFAWGLGFYGPSVYVHTLHAARGWSIAAVSGAVTFHFLFSALLVIFLSDAHARFGLAAVTRMGVLAFAVGVAGWAHAQEPWQLYAAAALTGIGWVSTSGAAINAFVSPWFDRRRALALSHAYNGASIGGVLFTPLWAALIARVGFEAASLIVGTLGLALLWPLAGRFLGRLPADMGLLPDGDTAIGDAAPAFTLWARFTLWSKPERAPRTRGELLRDRAFLSLCIAFSVGIFAQMGLITHLVIRLAPVLGDFGAAAALSLATCMAIIGRFAIAWLIGVEGRRKAGACNFLMQAVGVACLVLGETPAPLLAGCVLVGLGIGNLLSLPPLILQSEQHPADVGRALALLTAGNQLLYAFAPAVFGVLREATGSYTIPFVLAGSLQVLSAMIVVAGGRADVHRA